MLENFLNIKRLETTLFVLMITLVVVEVMEVIYYAEHGSIASLIAILSFSKFLDIRGFYYKREREKKGIEKLFNALTPFNLMIIMLSSESESASAEVGIVILSTVSALLLSYDLIYDEYEMIRNDESLESLIDITDISSSIIAALSIASFYGV